MTKMMKGKGGRSQKSDMNHHDQDHHKGTASQDQVYPIQYELNDNIALLLIG
jgi:hypothetical protein